MRYLLLMILVIAVALPAFATEYDVAGFIGDTSGSVKDITSLNGVFKYPAENELVNDNGTGNTWYTSGKACNTITMPYDCYLVAVKFFVNCPGSSGDIGVDVFEDSGSGSKPSDPSVSLIGGPISWANTGEDETWQQIDLPGPIFFANGTIVHPGQENGTSNNCGMHMDTDTSGTLGLWHWSSGDWQEWTSNYGHFMARLIVNDDVAGPVAAAQDPADGDVGVAVDVDILFDIDDSDIGVDSSTITDDSVVVTDDNKAVVAGDLSFDDTDPNNVHVTFDPDSDFPNLTEVTVTVSPSGNKILDDLGNEMAEDSWSFTVIASDVETASLGEIKAEFK